MCCTPNLMVKRKIHLSNLENFYENFHSYKGGKKHFIVNILLAISSCNLGVIGIRISPFITFYFNAN